MRKIILCVFTALFVCASNAAFAMPPVSYTFTGSPGNYLIEFTIFNNIPAEYNQHVSAFAVDLPYDDFAGTASAPYYWVHAPSGAVLNNSSQGGSNIDYTNIWGAAMKYDLSTGILTPIFDVPTGQSVSGFSVHADHIPDLIHFSVFAWDTLYIQNGQIVTGGPGYFEDDAFLKGHRIGFEGVLQGPQGVIPEPNSLGLMGFGLMGFLLRRRKNHSA